MTTIEKVGAYIAVAAFLVGVGISWNALNNRIDRVDEKIAAIQKTLGSTACTAILTRQIDAIEKGRVEARKALEGLSSQYGCVSSGGDVQASFTVDSVEPLTAGEPNLKAQLNAVDVLLNKGD